MFSENSLCWQILLPILKKYQTKNHTNIYHYARIDNIYGKILLRNMCIIYLPIMGLWLGAAKRYKEFSSPHGLLLPKFYI